VSDTVIEALRAAQAKVAESYRETARTAHPAMFALVPSLREWLDDPDDVKVSYDPETDEVTIEDNRK
jgi:hypothetical protein